MASLADLADQAQRAADSCGPAERVWIDAALADTIGCLIGGLDARAGAGAARARFSSGAERDALALAAAAHALDFDDNFFPAISHASAAMFPMLLALGAEAGAPLARIAPAYLAGLAVQARIGAAANPRHYESGWHATSTIGAIGAAAAAAVFLGSDRAVLAHAMGLATGLAGGSKRQFGTAAKPLHAGFAALHGILAAKLAVAGIDSEPDAIAGRWGFLDLHAGGALELASETPPDALVRGLVAKLYPSCMSSHLGIEALLELRARLGDDCAFDGVARVELTMPGFMIANLRHTDPEDGAQAKFSMQYCAALALECGTPRLADFADGAVRRASLRRWFSKVALSASNAAPDPELPWGGGCTARLTLADGTVHSARATHPTGSFARPLRLAQARAKFLDCAVALGEAAETLFDDLHTGRIPTCAGLLARLPVFDRRKA